MHLRDASAEIWPTAQGNAKKIVHQENYSPCQCSGRLHNFCIGEIPNDAEADNVPEQLDVDRLNIMNHEDGYVELEATADDTLPNLPLALMHGGEHFDDIPPNERRKHK